jgi:hypothetical protein
MPLKRKDGGTLTVGTHIVFRNLGKMNGSCGNLKITNTYEVLSKDNVILGTITWFSRWRKYAFNPLPDTTYEETCLREIAQFIEEETKAYKKVPKEWRSPFVSISQRAS